MPHDHEYTCEHDILSTIVIFIVFLSIIFLPMILDTTFEFSDWFGDDFVNIVYIIDPVTLIVFAMISGAFLFVVYILSRWYS